MKLALVSLLGLTVIACTPPSPAQQATDFANAEACVSKDWGQPITQIAQDCLGGVEQAAVDVVSDIGWILQKAGVVLPLAYTQDPRIQAKLQQRAAAEKKP